MAWTNETLPRAWGCPACKNTESFVDDTGHDEEGYVIRNRRCTSCGTLWATAETPIRATFWTRAQDRTERRRQWEQRKPRTCRRCGGPYTYGRYTYHVRLSLRHAAALPPPTNGSSREKVRDYQRHWKRRRAA